MKNKKTKIILISSILMVFLVVLIILLMQRKSRNLSQVEGMSAKATVYTRIGEQEFDITNLIEQNPIPAISAGMIPIKQEGEYWTIVDRIDDTWFNYAKGEPAYMMLNDGKYQSEEYYQMPKEKKLAEKNIGTQISLDDTDTLGSIYMWVPRFAYSDIGEIVYIKNGNVVGGSFTMPDCFTYEINNKYLSLSGIWVEINELEDKTKTTEKVANLNEGKEDTTYGFLAHTKANEMTEDEQTAVQKYIEYINNPTANDVGAFIASLQITNTNHTILKIIDIDKWEPIVANTTSDKKGVITISVTYKTNTIVQILDQTGKELMLNTEDEVITATTESQKNGKYKFYIIDNIKNVHCISALVEKESMTVTFDTDGGSNIESQRIGYYENANRPTDPTKQGFIFDDWYIGNEKYDFDLPVTENITITAKWEKAIEAISSFDENSFKITVTVTKNLNPIESIVYTRKTVDNKTTTVNKTLSTNSTTGTTEEVGNGTYEFKITDITGNSITITQEVTGVQVYIIETLTDLNKFKSDVNAGKTTSSTKAIQVANISGAKTSYQIGTSTNPFKGKYDGKGHSIGGLSFSGTSNYMGLFGYVQGTSSIPAKIENLVVSSSLTSSVDYVGGIVAFAQYTEINNCSHSGKIVGNKYVGGIVGYGYYGLKINNCFNTGEIRNNSSTSQAYVGGIVGYSINGATIANCYNTGNLGYNNTNNSHIGGILGYGYSTITVSYCYNTGSITGGSGVGGIVGYAYPSNTTNCTINYCYNTGEITSAYNGQSSIAGGISTEYVTANYCFNSGNVTTLFYAAGIVARYANNSYLPTCYNCYNSGTITSNKDSSGKAVGISQQGTATYCYNTGNIISVASSGGITFNGTTNCCYNTGSINGSRAGGISGYKRYNTKQLLFIK